MQKVEEIERFHSGIKKILKTELEAELQATRAKIEEIQTKIDEINSSISKKLADVENPEQIIERVVSVSTKVNKLKADNAFYEKELQMNLTHTNTKIQLDSVKDGILAELQILINDEMERISVEVQDTHKKSPKISFKKSNYSFQVFEDTGTGKAYIDLIILDLAIASLTKIPVLVHDSFLYKNIANPTVEKVFLYYQRLNKQVFVSVDELPKFSKKMNAVVDRCCVLRLSDSRLLFVKDWRNKSSQQ